MKKESEKRKEILEKHGYRFNQERDFWWNRATKKIFSELYVSDLKNEENLIKNIEETKTYFGEWQWYCNKIPSEKVKKDILETITPKEKSKEKPKVKRIFENCANHLINGICDPRVIKAISWHEVLEFTETPLSPGDEKIDEICSQCEHFVEKNKEDKT